MSHLELARTGDRARARGSRGDMWGDPKVPKGLNARHLTNHRVALRATFGTLPADKESWIDS